MASKDTRQSESSDSLPSAKKRPSQMTHVEIAFELESRGVSRETVVKWSQAEAQADLEKRRQEVQ